jgi:thiamine-phosphate pyrophosphorylase
VTLPRLYVVLDVGRAASHRWDVLELGRAFIDGGARLIQLRAKAAPGAWLLTLADALVAAAAPSGARIIVNDRPDIALLAGAAGVHVGQDDLAPADVRRVLGDSAVVGWSTHNLTQVTQAASEPISYAAIGPVFQTTTKDTGYEPVGLDLVGRAAAMLGGKPVVAIGGITLATACQAIEAGAASVAVTGDLLATGDPAARVREYVARLAHCAPTGE